MPLIELSNVRLRYQLEGSDLNAPVLMLSNSLGTKLEMWDPLMEALLLHYRILRYDTRGHGLSSVPPGPYSIADLGLDVVELLTALHIEEACYCGLSIGGITGLWLGIHQPQLFAKLVLVNTGARLGTTEGWNQRIASVQQNGMSSFVDGLMERWFTAGFRASAPATIGAVRAMLLESSIEGYIACCAVLRAADLTEDIARIKTRCLILSGSEDPVAPVELSRQLHEHIHGSKLIELHAAHLSPVEKPEAFTAAVVDFLARKEAPPSTNNADL